MIKAIIAITIIGIASVVLADEIPTYRIDTESSESMKYDGVIREKTIEIKPKYYKSEDKHVIINRRPKKYPTGEVIRFDEWYEYEPDSSIDRYYCDEVDEGYEYVVCGLTQRVIFCVRAPCPQPEPAWKNYRSSADACETGKIIEYIKQPCKSLPNNSME